MVHIGWKGSFVVPEIPMNAVEVLDQLTPSTRQRIFTHKSYNADPDMNYEILEYVGDAAILFCTTILIEEQYAELLTAWRHVSRGERVSTSDCAQLMILSIVSNS